MLSFFLIFLNINDSIDQLKLSTVCIKYFYGMVKVTNTYLEYKKSELNIFLDF